MTDDVLTRLAAIYGTPLYVYDLDAIERRVLRLRDALPGVSLHYAVKANASRAILDRLVRLGVGVEAITVGEIARALRSGVPAAQVVVGGPGQDADMRSLAHSANVARVSLDSEAQWSAWREHLPATTRFLVRVRPGFDPKTHEHLATGAPEAKFGLPPDRALALARQVAAAGRLDGFHVHIGSMIGDPQLYAAVLDGLAPLFDALPEATTIDLGGGFAVPDFDVERYAADVLPWVHERELSLLVEPGRWLVADAGVLLTRVLWRKEGTPVHWICDAGMAQLLRPALYGAEHPIRVVARGHAEGPATSPPGRSPARGDVDGPLCENADRLGRDRELDAGEGDLLAVERTGAYGMAMASNYASDLRPAEVVLDGGRDRLVRLRESPEDLWRLEDGAQTPG